MKNLQVYTAEELELHIRGDIEAWDLDTLRARFTHTHTHTRVCVYACVCLCMDKYMYISLSLSLWHIQYTRRPRLFCFSLPVCGIYSIHADHGFTDCSMPIVWLMTFMATMDKAQRRLLMRYSFVSFIFQFFVVCCLLVCSLSLPTFRSPLPSSHLSPLTSLY